MDDRRAGILLEAVVYSLGATVLEPGVQGMLCVKGRLRLAGMSPAGSLRLLYTPDREQYCFTLDIRSEQPFDQQQIELLIGQILCQRDSGGQLVYPLP